MKTRDLLGMVGCLLFLLSACSAQPEGGAISVKQQALTGSFFPRPDARDCPSPSCGGFFLIAPDSGINPCAIGLGANYVTGIFRRVGGSLVGVFSACNQLITGSTEADPENPGFEIFVLAQ